MDRMGSRIEIVLKLVWYGFAEDLTLSSKVILLDLVWCLWAIVSVYLSLGIDDMILGRYVPDSVNTLDKSESIDCLSCVVMYASVVVFLLERDPSD